MGDGVGGKGGLGGSRGWCDREFHQIEKQEKKRHHAGSRPSTEPLDPERNPRRDLLKIRGQGDSCQPCHGNENVTWS